MTIYSSPFLADLSCQDSHLHSLTVLLSASIVVIKAPILLNYLSLSTIFYTPHLFSQEEILRLRSCVLTPSTFPHLLFSIGSIAVIRTHILLKLLSLSILPCYLFNSKSLLGSDHKDPYPVNSCISQNWPYVNYNTSPTPSFSAALHQIFCSAIPILYPAGGK